MPHGDLRDVLDRFCKIYYPDTNYISAAGERSGDLNDNINISGTLCGIAPSPFYERSILYNIDLRLSTNFPILNKSIS